MQSKVDFLVHDPSLKNVANGVNFLHLNIVANGEGKVYCNTPKNSYVGLEFFVIACVACRGTKTVLKHKITQSSIS